MRKSQIFEEFIKIAEERQILPTVKITSRQELADVVGLTEAEAKEKATKISKLYNLKTENIDGKTYDFNIVELAHPNPAVVAISYDKVNGLVENVNECSSIMQDIATRTPRGNGIPKKYAEKQLMMSLLRVANELDSRDIDDLRILADTCVAQTATQMKKVALAPLVIAGIAGAAAVLGGLYAKQHMAFISDGFEKDHAKLLAEINDVLESSSDFGIGKEYSENFIKAMQSLQKDANDFYSIYKTVVPVLERLNAPKSGAELMEEAKKTNGHEVENAYKTLNAAANNLLPKLDFLRRSLTTNTYKNMQVKEKGWFTDLAEKSGLIGGKGLIADDMDDVSHAIETYMKDIEEVSTILRTAGEYADNAKKQMADVQTKSVEQTIPVAQEPNADRTVSEIDAEADELNKLI